MATEPMIDSRRFRIANGTASLKDSREVAAENQVIRELRGADLNPDGGIPSMPASAHLAGVTEEEWIVRHCPACSRRPLGSLCPRHRKNIHEED